MAEDKEGSFYTLEQQTTLNEAMSAQDDWDGLFLDRAKAAFIQKNLVIPYSDYGDEDPLSVYVLRGRSHRKLLLPFVLIPFQRRRQQRDFEAQAKAGGDGKRFFCGSTRKREADRETRKV